MASSLRLALWNANGISNHIPEVITFLQLQDIDVLLVSETHATARTVIKIPRYSIYLSNHPDGTAHGGSAVIIKNSIAHHEWNSFQTNKIQSSSIKVQVLHYPLIIAAVYSPPRHAISAEEYVELLQSLDARFIIGGDWNAKNVAWGSRLTNPKGRNLLRVLQNHNCNYLSTGEPTYWPTDTNKIPDLLDFAISCGIANTYTKVESNYDLSSDHTPVLITLSTSIITKEPSPKLCTKNTSWDCFRSILDHEVNLAIRIKDAHDLDEATQYLTTTIQNAAWQATPSATSTHPADTNIPRHIRHLVTEKRKARKKWQQTKQRQNKTLYNRLTHQLHTELMKVRNDTFQYYITNLSPIDHTIWKATKKFNRPTASIPPIKNLDDTWARSDKEKADTFADHLATVFSTPQPIGNNDDTEIASFLDVPCQMSLPLRPFSPAEVSRQIKLANPRKAPGYDLIVGEVLQNLPRKALVLLTTIFNSILRLNYFPAQWKHALIIMLPKPGKPPTQTSSYRPISLLPLMSKIFEKLLLTRIHETVDLDQIIPNYQFGFRQHHSTIHQGHRIVNTIMETLETKRVCTTVCLDIKQAFDKVWHMGLLYKIKLHFPSQLYLTLKSYLTERTFQVKVNNTTSEYHEITSGVPQGSVLGPLLYTLYTSDTPTTDDTLLAMFADDTAILSVNENPITAAAHLQTHLDILQNWFNKWRITVNSDKSAQITFTNKRIVSPRNSINNVPIPQKTDIKYLGLHLDHKLTWSTHIKAKRKQIDLKIKQMNWLIGRRSQLTLSNKLLLYKCIIKPIWTYGIQLWGCAKASHTRILQRCQSKILRTITNAPWYVTNETLHTDLRIPYVASEIQRLARTYTYNLPGHGNQLIEQLSNQPTVTRRLKRQWPQDLPV